MQRFTCFCNYIGMMLSLIGIVLGVIIAILFYYNTDLLLINNLVTVNEEIVTYSEENVNMFSMIFLIAGGAFALICLIAFILSAVNYHIVNECVLGTAPYVVSGIFSIIFGPRIAGLLTIIFGLTDY